MNELHHRTKPVLVVWLLSLFLSVNLFADEIPETEYDSLAGIFSNFQMDIQNNSNDLQLFRAARILEGFSQAEEYQITSNIYNSTAIKKILIIAKRNAFTDAAFHILRYAHDIHNTWGCEVKVFSVNGETETDIKGLITTNSSNLNA